MSEHSAQLEGRKLRLNLYGPIGGNPLMGSGGGGITAAWVAEQVASSSGIEQIEVYINSPGGDVFEGIAIYNELKQFEGQVNVFVMGVAASIASIIMMAGDQRVVYDGADVMIHQASGLTFGTADEHLGQAKALRRLDTKLARIYADTTGGDMQTIAELMSEETWMDADSAIADGFATHRSPQEAVMPPVAGMAVFNTYQHVPLRVAAWQASGPNQEPETETPAMADPTMKPEDEPKAEDVETEGMTLEELAEKMASLEAKIAEMTEMDKPEEGEEPKNEEGGEEEKEDAKMIASAFAGDNEFAIKMIAEGKTLAQAQAAYVPHAQSKLAAATARAEGAMDGVNAVATASRPNAGEVDSDLESVLARAKGMRSEVGRLAFLNDRDIKPNQYEAWLKANH